MASSVSTRDKRVMGQVLSTSQAIQISNKLKEKGIRVVLVGGCFDILHVGHIAFLTKAKHEGDTLMVLLESDATIAKLKGNDRPINTQEDRATVLASLTVVDYVVSLPELDTNAAYDELIFALKPAIIATTQLDEARMHKERQAKKLGIQLYDVVSRIKNKSTSRVSALLRKEL